MVKLSAFLVQAALAGLYVGCLDKRDDITNFPRAIGYASRQRGRYAQRLKPA
jgi:hypothetical protein